MVDELVARGMRAQLKTGSLLTGKQFVDLGFHPDAPPAKVRYDEAYPVLPTIVITSYSIHYTKLYEGYLRRYADAERGSQGIRKHSHARNNFV